MGVADKVEERKKVNNGKKMGTGLRLGEREQMKMIP